MAFKRLELVNDPFILELTYNDSDKKLQVKFTDGTTKEWLDVSARTFGALVASDNLKLILESMTVGKEVRDI